MVPCSPVLCPPLLSCLPAQGVDVSCAHAVFCHVWQSDILMFTPHQVAEEHYKDLASKPFYKDLVSYIVSGPVVCMVRHMAWPLLFLYLCFCQEKKPAFKPKLMPHM